MASPAFQPRLAGIGDGTQHELVVELFSGVFLMRASVTLAGLVAVALWSGAASAHGCHHGWQQSMHEGWHSHGAKCDTRKGLGVSRKAKPQGRRPA